LGKELLMRVPFPAARTTTASMQMSTNGFKFYLIKLFIVNKKIDYFDSIVIRLPGFYSAEILNLL